MTIQTVINSHARHVGGFTTTAVIHGRISAKSSLNQAKVKNSTGTLTKAAAIAENTGVNNTVNSDNEWGFPLHMIDHGPNMGLIMDLAA